MESFHTQYIKSIYFINSFRGVTKYIFCLNPTKLINLESLGPTSRHNAIKINLKTLLVRILKYYIDPRL